MSRTARLLAVAAATALLAGAAPAQRRAPAPAATDVSSAARIRGHVEFLASDLLEGRDTGSRGYALAAAYVAAEFRKLGLRPAGSNGGWHVDVPFRRARHAQPPELRILAGGRSTQLTSGRDFGLRPSLTLAAQDVEAPLVFAGHGISDLRVGIDEYAGLDVRGKIVVVLDGAPAGLPSDVSAHLQSFKDEVAAAKGAAGILYIDPPPGAPSGRQSGVARRLNPRTGWVAADGMRSSASIAIDAAVTPVAARALFRGSPQSLEAVQALAGKRPVAGFNLPGTLRIKARSRWDSFTSPEVVALLPGSDPALAGEHVLLAAHLDHLGLKEDARAGEDNIYNGAVDNAGGVATLIEAARSFAALGVKPRRSILFVAHTGEERGLLGADYLAAHPPVPAERLAAHVNLDMPLLLYDFTDVIAFGAEHSTMAGSVAAAAASMSVALSPDPLPEETLFTRSDHYPFVRQGVPSVFLMTGHANGGKQVWDAFLSKTYHSVGDDLTQTINWQAGARFAELNFRIARTLADAPERPRWYRTSYFGQTFASGQEFAAPVRSAQPRTKR
jgi:hypothetical protein